MPYACFSLDCFADAMSRRHAYAYFRFYIRRFFAAYAADAALLHYFATMLPFATLSLFRFLMLFRFVIRCCFSQMRYCLFSMPRRLLIDIT